MFSDINAAIHEEAFVKSFIAKDYRERLAFELRKRRGAFLSRFCHEARTYLDPRFVTEIPKPNSNRVGICRQLRQLDAQELCYAISSSDDIDGRTVPLDDGLSNAVGFGLASILSCLPGELAYLETEQVAGSPHRFILFRPKGQ